MVDGYKKVFLGAYCEILFAPKVLETFISAPDKDRAKMEYILDYLSEHGPVDLNNVQFKAEARLPCPGGKQSMVYAAKAYQLRIYGCFQKGPPKAFVCPEGVIKKTNKADQKLLKRVAKKAGEQKMAINTELLGPRKGEEEAFAIEALVFSVQIALQKAMNRKGFNNKELAERLGMTPARVSQIFSSNGPNLTLKTIAKIACALGEDFELIRKEDIKGQSLPESKAKGFKPVVLPIKPRPKSTAWQERAANKPAAYKRNLAA